MHFRTFLTVLFVPLVLGFDRKIISKLNPGCERCNTTLVYTQAVGSHDTIHQIWDFTRGMPTIIFAVGSTNSTIKVLWEDTEPKSFELSEKPQYSFALAAKAIYEYNDLKDDAQFSKDLPHRIYPFDRFTWTLNASSLGTPAEATAKLHSSYFRKGVEKNCVDFKMVFLPYSDYGALLPHLVHSANSTLLDIDLVNLTTSRDYNSSRFALHFVMVSTDDEFDQMRLRMRKSLDDEHTPGVFEIIEVRSPASANSGAGAFLQFRPVAYTQTVRSVDTSTVVRTSSFNRSSLPPYSSLRVFYRDFDPRQLLLQDFFINFGESGDGFYDRHNYTSWSFTLGYGAPPIEGFSSFVIMIISIGLGVPVLLALSGIVYVLVRRMRARNRPERLTEDME